MPSFAAGSNLKSFIDKELFGVLKSVKYLDGTKEAEGYAAEIIPALCKMYLSARRAGKLTKVQESLATQSEILYDSFAKVGIIALVDEATGFQHFRKSDALRILVESYIREDARSWTKEFSDEFFASLDEIYGNKKTTSRERPPYYGRFINAYIYDPIERGILLKLYLNLLKLIQQFH